LLLSSIRNYEKESASINRQILDKHQAINQLLKGDYDLQMINLLEAIEIKRTELKSVRERQAQEKLLSARFMKPIASERPAPV
ncbi:hypothetical protein, partial [Salmonella enterica]|uniref:hypothetical protein n=1 Tax=Salmonella enterica TaxID=28901 RepID=UPI003D2AF341